METIYREHVDRLTLDDLDKYFIYKKFGTKRLNAACNERLRSTIIHLIYSSDLKDVSMQTIWTRTQELLMFSEHTMEVRLVNPYERIRCKNCNLCKKTLNKDQSYKFKLIYDNTPKLTTCMNCMKDICSYTKEQMDELGKYEISKVMLLWKQTDIYHSMVPDIFYYIFKLSLH